MKNIFIVCKKSEMKTNLLNLQEVSGKLRSFVLNPLKQRLTASTLQHI